MNFKGYAAREFPPLKKISETGKQTNTSNIDL